MDKKIVIGAIVAPHGVRGEFRIMPLTETPDIFLRLEHIFLEDGSKLSILAVRFHKNVLLVKAKEVDSMDAAEQLRGLKVLVECDALPPLEDGQYYVSDLIGFEVKDESNMVIGFLKEVLSTGSNDVFVIKSITGEEILLPALKVNVNEISLQNREIRVKLPEWAE